MAKYDSHPFADILPINDGQPLWDLADDIKEHGQQEPIITYRDAESSELLTLDGRRRLLACHKAKVKPWIKEFKGTEEEALNLVISRNLHRRDLSTSQRAMAAAEFIAKKKIIVEKHRENEKGRAHKCAPTLKEAAEKNGVSRRSATNAAKVVEHGTPELQEAVKDGTVKVRDAAEIADKPPDKQNAAVDAVRNGKSKTAKEAVGDAETPDTDPDGLTIPDEAKDAFQTAEKIYSLCSALDTIGAKVGEVAKLSGGEMINCTSITQSLKTIRQTLFQSRATHVCPYCDGKDMECKACKGRFWTTKALWSASPKVEARRT